MNSKNKVLKLIISYFGGDDVVYLPVEENIDDENVDTFKELKEKWEKVKWGYHGTAEVKLIKVPKKVLDTVKDFDNTTRCTELDIWCFTDLMHDPELYSRPFDKNPQGSLFSCNFAIDCMKGEVYSKDFAYFECADCNRTICEQNPSNGWHVQYRHVDGDCGDRICLKCYEEQQFKEGVDIDDVIRKQQLPGMFFNTSDLEREGFEVVEGWDSVEVGMGRITSTEPSGVFKRLADARDQGVFKDKIVIINYESMAIGGLGGYFSIYVKPKQQDASDN